MLNRLEQVVMVVPVDAEIHKTQNIAQERGNQRTQCSQRRFVRPGQLQNHDRDQNGDDSIAECLHAGLAHRADPAISGKPRLRFTSALPIGRMPSRSSRHLSIYWPGFISWIFDWVSSRSRAGSE